MAALVTLQEIVDYLQSLMGPAAAPAAAAPAPVAPAAAAPAPVASVAVAPAAGVDLVGDMLAVVADKTGYPVEMLDLSMALEADLVGYGVFVVVGDDSFGVCEFAASGVGSGVGCWGEFDVDPAEQHCDVAVGDVGPGWAVQDV
ncbi:hypothetical protein NM962_22755 [Mycobacterium sp. SVM_VP21]|nr:hypothetical protein NM962_22755 [Mycobacterium sp. SVM_VP21]